jgi:hypothetical protein
MGDVVSLVERAAETVKIEDAEKLARKMEKGKFDLDDLRLQISQMQRMGGLGALANMLPGMKGMKGAANIDEKALVRLEAMMSSMTAKERASPSHQRQAQDPHRQGQRDHRSGGQQASEDAFGDVERDEAAEKTRRLRQIGIDVFRWGNGKGAGGDCSRRRAPWRAARSPGR